MIDLIVSLQIPLVYFLACCLTRTTGSGSCHFCLTRGRNVGSAQSAGLAVCCLARRRNTRHTGTALWVPSSGSANRYVMAQQEPRHHALTKRYGALGSGDLCNTEAVPKSGKVGSRTHSSMILLERAQDTKCPITRGQF